MYASTKIFKLFSQVQYHDFTFFTCYVLCQVEVRGVALGPTVGQMCLGGSGNRQLARDRLDFSFLEINRDKSVQCCLVPSL